MLSARPLAPTSIIGRSNVRERARALANGRHTPLEVLTPRERDVALLIAQGQDTKQVAAALGIAGHTVRRHLERIFAKLGVRSRLQLVTTLWAMRDD